MRTFSANGAIRGTIGMRKKAVHILAHDTRRGRTKARRDKVRDNEASVKRTKRPAKKKAGKSARPETPAFSETTEAEAAARELRSKMPGTFRDKKIFMQTGRPDASSLTLANKVLFAAIHEMLHSHKRLCRHTDPDKIDWAAAKAEREAKSDWAMRELNNIRRKCITIKTLCDGVVRAAKVQAEIDLDTLPERLILEAGDVLDARLGVVADVDDDQVDADTVH